MDNLGFLRQMPRINHVMRNSHCFREINADKMPKPFASPESDQFPSREVADGAIDPGCDESDILDSRRFFERLTIDRETQLQELSKCFGRETGISVGRSIRVPGE